MEGSGGGPVSALRVAVEAPAAAGAHTHAGYHGVVAAAGWSMGQKQPKESERPTRVLLCGACVAGNMGGPALCISMVDSLRLVGEVEVTLLSKCPRDERGPCGELNWNMVSSPHKGTVAPGRSFLRGIWAAPVAAPAEAVAGARALPRLSGRRSAD